MKNKSVKEPRESKAQRQHKDIFVPYQLPYQGLYTDRDSLEQPSALESVPTTASPAAEAFPHSMSLHAKLERDI